MNIRQTIEGGVATAGMSAGEAKAAILCRKLSKTYHTMEGQGVVALEDIDLAVSPGEFVSVVGPSGCGKSTLMKIFAGLLDSSSGEARIFSNPVTGPRKDVGVVFQTSTLIEWRNVMSNVMVPADVVMGQIIQTAIKLSSKAIGIEPRTIQGASTSSN